MEVEKLMNPFLDPQYELKKRNKMWDPGQSKSVVTHKEPKDPLRRKG